MSKQGKNDLSDWAAFGGALDRPPPPTPTKANRVADLTRGNIRKIWAKHGGAQHGPRVETMTIPEADFFAFVTEILDIERTKRADMTEFCTSIARELDIMLEVEF